MLICFTDLDGTLLNHDDYRYDAAIPTIETLARRGFPLIPTTSKTKAEVIQLRQDLGLREPFIVENGSGILLEPDDGRFDFTGLDVEISQDDGSFLRVITLGISYKKARAALKTLSQRINETLVGFGDLNLEALQALTQLTPKAAKQAGDRQFSEPFLHPNTSLDIIETFAAEADLKILVGNRFCHLMGAGASKGRAAKILLEAWCQAHVEQLPPMTLGLGDSPNDLSLLEAVDVAIVVPGIDGVNTQLLPTVQDNGWLIAPQPGCRGWAAAVETQLSVNT